MGYGGVAAVIGGWPKAGDFNQNEFFAGAQIGVVEDNVEGSSVRQKGDGWCGGCGCHGGFLRAGLEGIDGVAEVLVAGVRIYLRGVEVFVA